MCIPSSPATEVHPSLQRCIPSYTGASPATQVHPQLQRCIPSYRGASQLQRPNPSNIDAPEVNPKLWKFQLWRFISGFGGSSPAVELNPKLWKVILSCRGASPAEDMHPQL